MFGQPDGVNSGMEGRPASPRQGLVAGRSPSVGWTPHHAPAFSCARLPYVFRLPLPLRLRFAELFFRAFRPYTSAGVRYSSDW